MTCRSDVRVTSFSGVTSFGGAGLRACLAPVVTLVTLVTLGRTEINVVVP